MKIPAQVKIAELERRIQALEDWRKSTSPVSCKQVSHERIFGREWHRMWESFDRVMKAAFGK